MPLSVIDGDLHVNGTLSSRFADPPDGFLSDVHVATTAAIGYPKLVHFFPVVYTQPHGSQIATETRPVYITLTSKFKLVAIQAGITGTVTASVDRSVTVDIKRGSFYDTPASVISTVFVFNNTTQLRQMATATITDPSAEVGDTYTVEVTDVAGVGTQSKGLIVVLWVADASI